MKLAVRVGVLLISLLASGAGFADGRDDYRASLIERLRETHLAEQPEWMALLHYRPHWLTGRLTSGVDSPSFFNSPDGKTDPEAEAEATLRAFFEPANEAKPDQHPQCRYIARYRWLAQQLRVDPRRLPEQPCPGFRDGYRKLDPDGLTLVFASAYLDNPASMFGHTLLRVDGNTNREPDPLLTYAVNFAADSGGERMGVVYAFKGLFGLYPGLFSRAPYYQMVKEYGDIQHRDLWEYRLGFDRNEVLRLLQHLWELHAAFFDYYFFDENCAYQLLSLFDVARPDLRLTDQFRWWAIPADTVWATVMRPGLLDSVAYREAASRTLTRRYQQLSPQLQDIAQGLAGGSLSPDAPSVRRLPARERAAVLEAAVDDATYRSTSGAMAEAEARRRNHVLLLERNQLDEPGNDPPAVSAPPRPDQGHRSKRVGLGYALEDDRNFLRLEFRPAYHDLLDPRAGYPTGAQVEFLNVAIRLQPDAPDAQLDRVDVIDVVSLSPWATPLRPVSWKVGLGAERIRFPHRQDPLIGYVKGGVGLSVEPRSGTIAYVFAQGGANVSEALASFATVGLGGSAGVLHDISDRWRVAITAEAGHQFFAESTTSYALRFSQRLTIDPNSALRLDLLNSRDYGASAYGVRLMWYWYL